MRKIVKKHDEVLTDPLKRKEHLQRLGFVKNAFNDK